MRKLILGMSLLAISFSTMAAAPNNQLEANQECWKANIGLYKKAIASFEEATEKHILEEIKNIYKRNKLSRITSITLADGYWERLTQRNDIYSVQAGNDSAEIEVIIPNKGAYKSHNLNTNALYANRIDSLGRISDRAVTCVTESRNSKLSSITITFKNHATDEVISVIERDSNFRSTLVLKNL